MLFFFIFLLIFQYFQFFIIIFLIGLDIERERYTISRFLFTNHILVMLYDVYSIDVFLLFIIIIKETEPDLP